MQAWVAQHAAVLFPVYFVGMWLLVSAISSYTSGWSLLAGRYRLTSIYLGRRWPWQSGQMRWCTNYGNCLTLGCDEMGLYLAVMPLLRFHHPPLLVPWTDVSVSYKRRLFWDFVRLGLGRDPEIPLLLRPKIAEKLKQAAAGHWPAETLG
jgi:hypothetical protein